MRIMEYAILEDWQKTKLMDLTIGEMFITQDEMEQVKTILCIHEIKDIKILRAVRNSVVKLYGDEFEHWRHNFTMGSQILANMSGVTATIDSMIFMLGGEV